LRGVERRGAEFAIDAKRGGKTFAAGEVMLEKCLSCKGKQHVIYDETLFEAAAGNEENPLRFAGVSRLEGMPAAGRFAFWKNELSRCLRCNACRNACPVCGCVACVFDNPDSPAASKANSECFEERMFHLIRAFHVAGRCTDCGECGRSCPQEIPLHLLNRKVIKDINRLYGTFQSGAAADEASPLTRYAPGDAEPGDVFACGGGK
jgi:ferredoxin